MDRRRFLQLAAVSTVASTGIEPVVAPVQSGKRVACLCTTYFRFSHADNIITRFLEGYSIRGVSYPPPCKVAALFIEQAQDLDIGRPLARRWHVPLHDSIASALTLGTGKLAVDGVVIVGEHGDYPVNDRGQILYPRRRFFEEVVKVFEASGRSVPVFNDKHLSYDWASAKWMYDQSRRLGFPLMAGSSVPVTWRKPDLRPALDTPWEQCLGVGYSHFEVYGFHTLEAMQVMAERRPGGETGVTAVQALSGPAVAEAATAGRWDRKLLDAAVATLPDKPRAPLDDDPDSLLYLIEYRDGLRGAAYLSGRRLGEFAYAGRVKGKPEPLACWYDLPKPQRDHFSFLTGHAAKMIVTGKEQYPVERTLLTGGMLSALVESKARGGQRVETPELAVKYRIA